MTEDQTAYEVPDGYLEDLRKRIEQANRELEELQKEYARLTGRRYQWFK